ncbi:hypothetical protein BDZ94DRAFT_1325343 [Collybia nuda]|uniref:Uncharacterized protein n=1 Tax=Collybia nuda TaxID=64659 RepID=A0A9P6CF54_9AGAR|nr:hypothetical protein BDZ94DRAFT_1325343 [Collybia nuda]
MSLKKMEPDWWIELESTYRERIAERKHLYTIHGKTILDSLPGSEKACYELMEMVLQFLCVRYPKLFHFDEKTGMFQNFILGSQSSIKTMDPLMFLLEHVPEDFLITQEDRNTGLYVLMAGVSCSAVGWNMATKMGKTLEEIHDPVPDYKEKMQFSMNRYFSKMPCEKPIQRGSWSLEIGQPLFLQPNDPHFKLRAEQLPHLDINDIYLRVDWQTLRRLPVSKAIVFNFKALFTPVTRFETEPYIPRLLAQVLRGSKSSFLEYKATHHVVHKLLPALDKWARAQEEKGWVPKGWKERTLDEDPFFPGWEFHKNN